MTFEHDKWNSKRNLQGYKRLQIARGGKVAHKSNLRILFLAKATSLINPCQLLSGLDWVFVDPDAKVSKYFLKDWKTTPGSSLNNVSHSYFTAGLTLDIWIIHWVILVGMTVAPVQFSTEFKIQLICHAQLKSSFQIVLRRWLVPSCSCWKGFLGPLKMFSRQASTWPSSIPYLAYHWFIPNQKMKRNSWPHCLDWRNEIFKYPSR